MEKVLYFCSLIWFFLLSACTLNGPGDGTSSASSSSGQISITTATTDPYVNFANQTRFPVHVVCAIPNEVGTITETGTSFICDGSNSYTTVTLNLEHIPEGNFKLSVLFAEGNSAVSSSIVKDVSLPVVTGVSPTLAASISNLYSSPDLNFNSAVDHGSGILKHQARILNSANNSIVLDWKNIDSGSHFNSFTLARSQYYLYQFRAIDIAGNISELLQSNSWQAIGPTVSITQKANNGTVTPSNQYAYTMAGTCNVVGGTITLKVTDTLTTSVQNTATCSGTLDWLIQADVSSLAAGTLNIAIDFVDLVNNAADRVTATLTK